MSMTDSTNAVGPNNVTVDILEKDFFQQKSLISGRNFDSQYFASRYLIAWACKSRCDGDNGTQFVLEKKRIIVTVFFPKKLEGVRI